MGNLYSVAMFSRTKSTRVLAFMDVNQSSLMGTLSTSAAEMAVMAVVE
jgi:hypothetical protein